MTFLNFPKSSLTPTRPTSKVAPKGPLGGRLAAHGIFGENTFREFLNCHRRLLRCRRIKKSEEFSKKSQKLIYSNFIIVRIYTCYSASDQASFFHHFGIISETRPWETKTCAAAALTIEMVKNDELKLFFYRMFLNVKRPAGSWLNSS